MKIKEINIGNIFAEKRSHAPDEVLGLVEKAIFLHGVGKGLRIEEKNDRKRNKLAWRLSNYANRNKSLHLKVSVKAPIIGVWVVC